MKKGSVSDTICQLIIEGPPDERLWKTALDHRKDEDRDRGHGENRSPRQSVEGKRARVAADARPALCTMSSRPMIETSRVAFSITSQFVGEAGIAWRIICGRVMLVSTCRRVSPQA